MSTCRYVHENVSDLLYSRSYMMWRHGPARVDIGIAGEEDGSYISVVNIVNMHQRITFSYKGWESFQNQFERIIEFFNAESRNDEAYKYDPMMNKKLSFDGGIKMQYYCPGIRLEQSQHNRCYGWNFKYDLRIVKSEFIFIKALQPLINSCLRLCEDILPTLSLMSNTLVQEVCIYFRYKKSVGQREMMTIIQQFIHHECHKYKENIWSIITKSYKNHPNSPYYGFETSRYKDSSNSIVIKNYENTLDLVYDEMIGLNYYNLALRVYKKMYESNG